MLDVGETEPPLASQVTVYCTGAAVVVVVVPGAGVVVVVVVVPGAGVVVVVDDKVLLVIKSEVVIPV